jgi:hypothetical protein
MKNISLKERYELKKIRENKLISEAANTEDKRANIARAAKKIGELSQIEGLKELIEPLQNELLRVAGSPKTPLRDWISRWTGFSWGDTGEVRDFAQKVDKFETATKEVAKLADNILKGFKGDENAKVGDVILGIAPGLDGKKNDSTTSVTPTDSTPETPTPATTSSETTPSTSSPAPDAASSEEKSSVPSFNSEEFIKLGEKGRTLIGLTEDLIGGQRVENGHLPTISNVFNVKEGEIESSVKNNKKAWEDALQAAKDSMPKDASLSSNFKQSFIKLGITSDELREIVRKLKESSDDIKQIIRVAQEEKVGGFLKAMLGIEDIADSEKYTATSINNILAGANKEAIEALDNPSTAEPESASAPESGKSSAEPPPLQIDEKAKETIKEKIKNRVKNGGIGIEEFKNYFTDEKAAKNDSYFVPGIGKVPIDTMLSLIYEAEKELNSAPSDAPGENPSTDSSSSAAPSPDSSESAPPDGGVTKEGTEEATLSNNFEDEFRKLDLDPDRDYQEIIEQIQNETRKNGDLGRLVNSAKGNPKLENFLKAMLGIADIEKIKNYKKSSIFDVTKEASKKANSVFDSEKNYGKTEGARDKLKAALMKFPPQHLLKIINNTKNAKNERNAETAKLSGFKKIPLDELLEITEEAFKEKVGRK